MKDEKLNKILKHILNLNKELNSKYVFDKKKKYKSKKKNKLDPVTQLDKKIELFIKKRIQKSFPKHNVLGEETKNVKNNSEYTWVIDPIDGTKNFILGLPTWSTLIGVYRNKECILSYINLPILKKFYLAYGKKNEVHQNNKVFRIYKKKNIKNEHIAINTFNTLRNKKLFEFFKKTNQLFRVTGGDAYNYCLFCEGNIDVIIEANLKKVDFMPIKLLLKNSGALITDWNGKKNINEGNILITRKISLQKKYIKLLNTNSR